MPPKPRSKKAPSPAALTANSLTRDILQALYNEGVFAWRENTTGVPSTTGTLRPSGLTGKADILGCALGGAFIAVEVKVGRDRLRPEQEGFLKNIKSRGGVALVVKDWEDFKTQWQNLTGKTPTPRAN